MECLLIRALNSTKIIHLVGSSQTRKWYDWRVTLRSSTLGSELETWGLMYEGCVRTKMWRTEMCGAPRQLHGWRTHVSTAIVTLATLRGDAGKLLIISKTISHQSDVHVRDTLMNN